MSSGFLTRCEERIQPLFIIAQFAFVFPFLLELLRHDALDPAGNTEPNWDFIIIQHEQMQNKAGRTIFKANISGVRMRGGTEHPICRSRITECTPVGFSRFDNLRHVLLYGLFRSF